MCRNIVKLRFPDRAPRDEELQAAALQYVRKITGYRKPSRSNQVAFDRAIMQITAVTRELFDSLQSAERPSQNSS